MSPARIDRKMGSDILQRIRSFEGAQCEAQVAETRRRTSQVDHDLSSFVGGVLLGGLIGAGAMLLLAPRSGNKTRRRIQQIGRDLREQTTGTMEDRVAQVRAKVQKVTPGRQGEAEAVQQHDKTDRLFREEALMVWGDEGGATG